MSMAPAIISEQTAAGVRLALAGGWTIDAGSKLERQAERHGRGAAGAAQGDDRSLRVEHMDTAGAWLIDRSRQALEAHGVAAEIVGAQPEHTILLHEAHFRPADTPAQRRTPPLTSLLADIGESVYDAGMRSSSAA